MLSGVLQSSDAMTEAMSSTGLWRGGGVGGKKRMWLPACRAGVRAVICGLPEPNKLQICPESCFGLQGLEECWEALVSSSFALGAKFEIFYTREQCFKQLTQPVSSTADFFLRASVLQPASSDSLCKSPKESVRPVFPNKESPNDAPLRPTQLRQKLRRILLCIGA